MEDDWSKLAEEDAKPAAKVVPVAELNKWAGEDEDDDIKDSWDADDDDEKKDEEKNEPQQPAKPRKTIQQKIAEKEKARLELEEKRRKEKEEEDLAHLTPEDRAAEKLRLKQLQEEASLKLDLDTLGLTSSSGGDPDGEPKTKEEFISYAEAISKKITRFRGHEEFVTLVDELVKSLCAGLASSNIRKIKTTVDNLYLEKQKMEKGDKPKKKAATKVKARLRIEGDDDYSSRAGAFEADDYDDFM